MRVPNGIRLEEWMAQIVVCHSPPITLIVNPARDARHGRERAIPQPGVDVEMSLCSRTDVQPVRAQELAEVMEDGIVASAGGRSPIALGCAIGQPLCGVLELVPLHGQPG